MTCKKLKIRKVLKEAVFKIFAECNATAEEEKLRSAYETLQRKINAFKNMEVEIIDISNDEKLIEDIVIDELLLMNLRSKQNQNWLL